MAGSKNKYQKELSEHMIGNFQSLLTFEESNFTELPDFIKNIRKNGRNSFLKNGLPTTKMEEWRFTDIRPIIEKEFVSSDKRSSALVHEKLNQFTIDGTNQITIINGYIPTAVENHGVTVIGIKDALQLYSNIIQNHLGKIISEDDHPFAALNSAHFEDGIFIHVPEGFATDIPLHLLFFNQLENLPINNHPRVLVVAENNSQIQLIEHHSGEDGDLYLTNSVTEIICTENSSVDHIRIQEESCSAYHISNTGYHLEKNSRINSHVMDLGGKLIRNNLVVQLNGIGSECDLKGLYLLKNKQHTDNFTRIHHQSPECSSRELYKGILTDHAHGIFTGRVNVHPYAKKTNAMQTNRNLLLSDQAVANSNPQLIINTDDVKCSHGSTTGQLNEEAIFYFQSRGISKKDARALLISGFASETMKSIKHTQSLQYFNNLLEIWLKGAG